MAKTPYKLPRVFVACPYDEKTFKYSKFKHELDTLPWTCIYANTTIETKHLLQKIKRLITTSDVALFDLSMWNPNVALELGLADGMNKSSYYILVNEKLSNDVPSDIKGIQRIQYSTNNLTKQDFNTKKVAKKRKEARYITDQLIDYFFKKEFFATKNLWKKLSGQKNGEIKYRIALAILVHLRDYDSIAMLDIKAKGKGTHFREADFLQITNALTDIGLIKLLKNQTEFRLAREIYKKG